MNVRVWFWGTLLLTRKIVALLLPLNGTELSPPPFPIDPGSPMLRPPDESAMFDEPLTPLTFAAPSQLETSETRFMSPTNVVPMSSR